MNPRVLLVTNDYPPARGGIQRYLTDLVRFYPGEMTVAAPADPRAEPAAGVFPGPSGFMWPTGGTYQWLRTVIRQTHPDVVLFGAPHPLAFLGARLGLPYAVLTHGAEVSIGRSIPGFGARMAAALRRAGAVLAVSRHTAAAVMGAAGVRAEVVGAGVDLAAFRPAAELVDDLVVSCVSRFVPRKGHHRVVAGAELAAAAGVACSVVLAGEGRFESRLRARAAAAEVPVDLIVSPADRELQNIYRRSAVFCMPATNRWWGLEREGLGLVYLEAAASGLPVLAGPSGGAPETIDPGVTGFVVETAEDIAEALGILSDTNVRRAFGQAARQRAETHHAWPEVADRVARVLRSLV